MVLLFFHPCIYCESDHKANTNGEGTSGDTGRRFSLTMRDHQDQALEFGGSREYYQETGRKQLPVCHPRR
ncbi:hypothetical protein C5167_016504 [Papaver somniferum]|nr:hypothetical protein C5167_016504 [Papaver somniferum]